MDFTLEFIQILFITLWYAGPIVVSLIALIVVLGHIIEFREGFMQNLEWFKDNWSQIEDLADFPPGMSSAVRN